MKIDSLKERIEKANEKIAKKENTIVKKTAQIEKKYKSLEKLGVEDPENKNVEDFRGAENWNDIYWIYCDIKHLNEDIRRGGKEIEETKKTIEKYEAQLSGEIEKESVFLKEIPEAMKTLQAELVTHWDETDKEKRDYMRARYKELGYKEFIEKHGYKNYEFRSITDDQIHNANEKDSKFFILDLYNRVRSITGEVTDWSGIRLEYGNTFPVLNGNVIGKEGRAHVESILAGGYNIQKLHIRTIVTSY